MKRIDYVILGIILIGFSVLVFYRIGSFTAPESFYHTTTEDRDIILDFGEEINVNHLSIYLGYLDSRVFNVSAYSMDTSSWVLIDDAAEVGSVFAWNQIPVIHNLRYLQISALDDEAILGELAVIAGDGSVILPVNAGNYPELFNEQKLFPPVNSYYFGTMFDEVYHGRTAYEFIHGLPTYETTHPPLGKSLISLGIRIFGMTPAGWRLIPALFGILMLPLFYLFGKVLFRNTLAAASVTLLLSVDCMHYTLSRIATIDIIAAFFIVFMYFLLFLYFYADLGKLKVSPYLPLGLCGIVMGLAVSVKWTGVYAGIGLGLLFFWYLIEHLPPRNQLYKLIGFCLIFFCVLPAMIYILSYLPFVGNEPSGNLLATVLQNQESMLSYHSSLESEHYYASPFYEWPLLKMPLLYATDPVTETLVSSVSCMGNPFIWWSGALCLLFTMYRWFLKKDKKAGFLILAYLAQYFPWFFVSRITFIYHYFPASLFMILSIGYVLDLLARSKPWGQKAVYGCLAVAVLVFIFFFPVVSGIPFSRSYEFLLRLLPDWILVL